MRIFNIKEKYVDEYDLWLVILSESAFTFRSTVNILKGYSLVKIVFGRDVIILIKHKVDW